MLYKIRLITIDEVSVEVDSLEEAQAKGVTYAAMYNKHHHHGEITSAQVYRVYTGKEAADKLIAMRDSKVREPSDKGFISGNALPIRRDDDVPPPKPREVPDPPDVGRPR